MQPQCSICALYGHIGRPNSGLWHAARELKADAAPSMDNLKGLVAFFEELEGMFAPPPQLVS